MVRIRADSRFIAMNLINVAIFGASGYSGEELVRRLAQHPRVRIVGLTSRQHAGKKASDLFPWLDPHSPVADLQFISPDAANLTREDVAAAFLGHTHRGGSELSFPPFDSRTLRFYFTVIFLNPATQAYGQVFSEKHPAP